MSEQSTSDTDRLRPQCFNPNCGETFDSVDEMVAVPGRGGRSPRHFCEPCAEQIRRGTPLTDGGRSSSGKYRWQCPECGAIVRSSDRPVSCDKCGAKTTLEWHGRVIPDGGVFEDDTEREHTPVDVPADDGENYRDIHKCEGCGAPGPRVADGPGAALRAIKMRKGRRRKFCMGCFTHELDRGTVDPTDPRVEDHGFGGENYA